MLGRLKTSKKGASLPVEWLESFSRLLNETYSKECKQHGRYFDVYGQIYAQELLVVVSFFGEKDVAVAPITLFLTCNPDQMSTIKKMDETQKNYIELAGLFFDEIFNSGEWNEFEPAWQEVTHNGQEYWHKISRENINLTLEADKLLGDDFDDVEFEEDLKH